MKKTIVLKKQRIEYELDRKNVKNINLRIRSDCSVYVSANSITSDSAIEKFLQSKADLILCALEKYKNSKRRTGYSYITGENFRYLGKDLELVVTLGKNNVKKDGAYLLLSAKDTKDKKLKKRLIDKWHDGQCKIVFTETIDELYPIFRKHNIAKPKLQLRKMTSRWGSCRPKSGIITLNKRLIETPRSVIEYVAMHEFVHFLYLNHSKSFYEMLSTLMPDWKKRKKMLETAM